MTKVAINGFGRIGRNTLRAAIREGIFNKIDYVAINDPGLKPEDAARIFKYDSVMGKFNGTVEAYDEDGNPYTLRVREELSVAFQHEIDHLNGILFYDHINKDKPFFTEDEIRLI